MRVFEILKATDSAEQRIIKTIRFDARFMRRVEGRSRAEAEYWSIRTLLDSLRAQQCGDDGARIVMKVVEERYPQHLQNILRYAAWRGSQDQAVEGVIASSQTKRMRP